MSVTRDLERQESEIVPRAELRLAVLAWERQTAFLLSKRDLEIEAVRNELHRVQALLEAAEIRLGERPRRKVARLKLAAASGG